MALVQVNNISLLSISAAVPKNKVFTKDYDYISEQERDMFIKTVGIEERRVAPPHLTAADLCYHSALQIINTLQWDKNSIDAIIFVTQSPDYFLPASSIILQHKLGLSKNTIAFDINLGCSGYVYGLYVLGSMLQNGQIKRAILLAGDKSTLSTCYKDKSTYPLFGDAGSATALEYNPNASPIFFNLQSDGSGEDAIKIPHGGSRYHIQPDTFDEVEIEPGIIRSKRHLQLLGADIFNFALREVSPNIDKLLEFSGISKDEINFFIFHQANYLMNESVRKKMKVDKSKVPYSIHKFGNTSSASIPLTIVTELKDQLQSLQTLLFSGFGVGFSWASCVFQSKNIQVLPLLEIE
ncbi:MAG: ketoacyl-ACP synthase III [Bacteroidota bacterium]